jgi:7,8-dihydropterin-6-yl-methyl-4-(beta-D-ribofuranosyl)aminobenzene 5'-phosphate synthase
MIEEIKIRFLVENSVYRSKLFAEHGLAVLIDGKTSSEGDFSILFDTGQSGDALLHNMKEMELSWNNIDTIILSHGHYDHTGGLEKLLEKRKDPIDIICHPNAMEKKFSVNNKKKRDIGIPFEQSSLEKLGANFIFSKKPTKLKDSMIITGEIERTNDFEKVPARFQKLEGEKMVHDYIIDDQSLIINTKDGIIIITGCSHSGIVNIVDYATKVSKSKEIMGVFGGFHLISADYNKINKTIEGLKPFNIEYVGPCHCTGLFAIRSFINEYLMQFRECSTGNEIFFRF